MHILRLFLLVFCELFSQVVLAQNAPPISVQGPPNTIEERVRACVSCHGQQGRGINNVYFPRLAGKPAGYLYNQLVAFREGRRKYAPMNYLLAYLPDEYLMKMAQYYADLELPYDSPAPATVSQDVLQQGRNLVQNGNPGKQIPACAACHGPNLSGREPGIPALIGLRSDYISAQLGAWRYGTRTAIEPDCMQLIAARLTEAEVAAVSAWLSSMPIPANTRPVPQSPGPLPLACGSQKH
jgi:cytochrome c553